MTQVQTPADEITWEPPDNGEWELESAHATGVVPRTMRAEFEQAFEEGFKASFSKLGLPLSHIALRHVNDWPYTSVFVHEAPRRPGKPPPAIVLKVLTRLHPKSRARTKLAEQAWMHRVPQGFASEWAAERQTWIDRILAHQRVNLEPLDNDALALHLEAGIELGHRSMRRHFELVAGAIPLGEWFVRTASWGLPATEARAAVMSGTPVHQESAERLERIRAALGDAEPQTLDQIHEVNEDASKALDDYLEHHGWCVTEDHVAGPVLGDFPSVILMSIRSAKSGNSEEPTSASLVASLRQQVPAADRDEFDTLAMDARAAYQMLDDNSAILGAWGWGVVARDMRTVGERLAAQDRLADPSHLWVLSTSQIVGLLRGAEKPTKVEASDAHEQWEHNGTLRPPAHLNGPPSPPPDPSVFPAPVARQVAAVGAFLNDKFNAEGTTAGIGDQAVTGRAVVVESASDALNRIQPGDILVTNATTPAFNGVLGIVGGLVVAHGGPSSHAAVVSRELGIPAIVGYATAMTDIVDGTTITLDPVSATVVTEANAG